ncbi:hypothetical protein EW146_g8830 [Bondarzewia mesenterica]|uniref:Uncharacterized protein n=1 Tax=Bondarzewia mesenterica TaxID=1095465 RepID=A0A4S4LGK6_9AGAM|nr:hypothetical protein EW146_g8830 [Bondarzewia mesenterica]
MFLETDVWCPPSYNTSSEPSLLTVAELSPDLDFEHNFARSAKWCPDGSMALAHCENRNFQFLDLQASHPLDHDYFYALQEVDISSEEAIASLPSWPKNDTLPQAAPILDFIWYPRATPREPASFCFVASVRESPVKLLDASTGRLRASYKIVDHRERQIAPHSLAFNFSADKLYCGFEDAIEVFDLNCPGEGTRLPTTPSRKSRDGLKGIISALAFCPSYDPSYSLFAAGSLAPSSDISSNICLFSEDTGAKPVGWVGDVKASVMQLAFNPMKPHILYASFRRHDALYSWDLRGDTTVPLQIFNRNASETRAMTNQRLRFDIDLGGNWLSVGDQIGDIYFFDLNEESSVEPEHTEPTEKASTLKYHAHADAVGSVAFHPLRPLLLSVSGSRHFGIDKCRDQLQSRSPSSSDDSSSDSSSEEEQKLSETKRTIVKRSSQRPQPSTLENSIKLWNFEAPTEI